MLASVTQSEGEKSMLNTATVFSLLLLPFHNAKLSRGGRTTQKMQGGTHTQKKEGHGEVSLRCKRDGMVWNGQDQPLGCVLVFFLSSDCRNKIGFPKERPQPGRWALQLQPFPACSSSVLELEEPFIAHLSCPFIRNLLNGG